MRYGLTRLVFEETVFLEITADEYKTAALTIQGILESLSIEEKLNLVLENYEEYERDLLGQTLHESLFTSHDWSTTMSGLHHINRRLVNLLTTCRLYVDQVKHNLHTLYGDASPQAEEFVKRTSQEYDSHLGYRAMEAMRNYVQHRNLPIHAINHESKRRETNGEIIWEHTVTPEVEPERLREDGGFKASVLDELEKLGKRVDIKPLVRKYIAGLGRVHLRVRELLAADLVRWEQHVKALGEQFQAAGASDLTGLVVVADEGSRVYTGIVHISPSPINRRRWLQAKNQRLTQSERTLIASARTA